MRLGKQLCRALFATCVRFFLYSFHYSLAACTNFVPTQPYAHTPLLHPLFPSFPRYSLTITNAHTQLGPTVGAEARQG